METQAQVISKGMRWTQSMADKAKLEHQYIKIGAKGGSSLTITGADKFWKKPGGDDFLYLPDLRIAGSKSDLTKALTIYKPETGPGFTEAQINSYLANAYTSSNYNVPSSAGGKAEAYNAEVSAYTQYKSAKKSAKAKPAGPTVTLSDLSDLISKMNEAEIVKTSAKSRKAANAEAANGEDKPKKAGRHLRLAQRLNSLAPGLYLDVSNMKDDESNVKTVKKVDGKKKSVEGVRIISSNFEKFEQAMKILGPEFESFIAKYPKEQAKPVATAATSTATSTTSTAPAVTAAPTAPVLAVPATLNKVSASVPKAGGLSLSSVPKIPISGMPSIPTRLGSPK